MEIVCSFDVVEQVKLDAEAEAKAKKEAEARAYLGDERVVMGVTLLQTITFNSDYFYRNDVIDETVHRILAYIAIEGIRQYAESGETKTVIIEIYLKNKEFQLTESRQITVNQVEWKNLGDFMNESPQFEYVSNSIRRMLSDYIQKCKEKQKVTDKQ